MCIQAVNLSPEQIKAVHLPLPLPLPLNREPPGEAILRRENELRLGPETKERLVALRGEPAGWLRVMELLQRQVAREFGLTEVETPSA